MTVVALASAGCTDAFLEGSMQWPAMKYKAAGLRSSFKPYNRLPLHSQSPHSLCSLKVHSRRHAAGVSTLCMQEPGFLPNEDMEPPQPPVQSANDTSSRRESRSARAAAGLESSFLSDNGMKPPQPAVQAVNDTPPRRIGSETLARTAQWFDSSTLMGELTTDDGIPVSELAFDGGRRSDWVRELLTLFNSKVLSRIVNRMAFTIAWSLAVTTLISIGSRYPDSDMGFLTDFKIPGWPHELVGGFLAILLVFRTDQAYDRFWEGRRQWAELSTACRDLGRVTMSNVQGPMVDELLAHIAVFPVALKQHLRGSQNRDEIAAVFNTYLPANSSYIELVTASRSMPSTVLLSMSNVISDLRRAPRAKQLDVVWQNMENKLSDLSDIVAECEKIKCSPLPLSYSRHTSRFFSIFTLTLPFAVVNDTTPWLVPGIVAFVSWVLFVTEEIGHVIEEPFGVGIAESDVLFSEDDERAMSDGRINDLDVKALFKKLDRDGSGRIDTDEILEILPDVLSMDLTEEAKQTLSARVMSKMDLNGNGFVEYGLLCPHTTIYLSSYYYICVRILLCALILLRAGDVFVA